MSVETADAVVRAIRLPSGLYRAKDHGRLAVDGSELDSFVGADHVASGAWRDPTCRTCTLPQFRRLVPPLALRCPEHGVLTIPDVDPFPMDDEEAAICERRAWREVRADCPLPAAYDDITLKGSRPTPAIRAVREFIDTDLAADAARCLVLAGPTGVGKTWALVAAFRHLAVWTGPIAMFLTEAELFRRLLQDEDGETRDAASNVELLALDDVGAAYRKPGGLAETLFEEILVEREVSGVTTLISTNLTIARFEEVVGDRIADRLRGDWGVWISLPGESLRRKRSPGRRQVKPA